MRNNKRRNVLTHARVNFSQSETSSLLRGGGGGGGGRGGRRRRGVNRKDPRLLLKSEPEMVIFTFRDSVEVSILMTDRRYVLT